MFTNSVVEPIDSGTVHLHSDTTGFTKDFPKYLLDDAFSFACKQLGIVEAYDEDQKKKRVINPNTIQIAVQLSDDSLPYAVRLMQELEDREAERRKRNKAVDENDKQMIIVINFFILADNTFAPCCADQVTAQRNNADAIIHFGQTCFSQSIDSIPCSFFVPPWSIYSSSSSSSASSSSSSSPLVKQVLKSLEKGNDEKMKQILTAMESIVFVFSAGIKNEDLEQFKKEVFDSIDNSDNSIKNKFIFSVCGTKSHELTQTQTDEKQDWNVDGASFPIAEKTGRQLIFFLSPSTASSLQKEDDTDKPQNSPLHQLALIEYWNAARRVNHEEEKENDDGNDNDDSSSILSSIIPSWFQHLTPSATTSRTVSTVARDVSKRVNQRMRNIEALAHADSIGLLVMSLSISEHRNLLSKLQTLLRSGGKRVYVIFIGHLNEYKLANFADSIDVFVSLACPNSRPAFFASKDDNFNAPLLFPAEVTLWYERDVKNISEESVGKKFLSPQLFTTRAARSMNHIKIVTTTTTTTTSSSDTKERNDTDDIGSSSNNNNNDGALIVKAPMHIANTSTTKGTLTKFQERSYQGLDPRYGKDDVQGDVVEGLSGIAKGYETVVSSRTSGDDTGTVVKK